MIEYKTGNIFNSNCECLVNPVNCYGVMGAGLAKQFARKYSVILNPYKRLCSSGELNPGTCKIIPVNKKSILLFPTKDHWKNPSKLEYIDTGLQNFVKYYEDWQIKSVAFPMLGCGLGGLKKQDVLDLYEKHLYPLFSDIKIEIYT